MARKGYPVSVTLVKFFLNHEIEDFVRYGSCTWPIYLNTLLSMYLLSKVFTVYTSQTTRKLYFPFLPSDGEVNNYVISNS